jgi:hypothetical protein
VAEGTAAKEAQVSAGARVYIDGGCEAWPGLVAAHAASSVPLRKGLRVRLRSRQMSVQTSRAVRDGRSGPLGLPRGRLGGRRLAFDCPAPHRLDAPR